MSVATASPGRDLFRLAGVPVRIHLGFFVTAALMGATRRGDGWLLAEWVAVTLVSVLVHELGHALAFRSYGHSPSITLHGMGGTTYGSAGLAMTPRQTVVTCLAGPAAGFALGGAILAIQRLLPEGAGGWRAAVAIDDLLWVNLGWGAVNLLPLLPLDGGQVMRALIAQARKAPSERLALWMSLLTAAAGIAAGLWWNQWVAVLFGGYIAAMNAQALWQLGRELAEAPFHQQIDAGLSALDKGEVAKAHALAREQLARATSDSLRRKALHLEAWAYLLEKNAADGLATLRLLKENEAPDPYLHGSLLLEAGESALAIEPMRAAFVAAPSAGRGAGLATALAGAGRLEEALALLDGPGADTLGDEGYGRVEAALFFAGRYQQALEVSERRFTRFRQANAAYNAACSLAKLQRREEGLGWLERAIDAGYRDAEHLDADEDLAALREGERYRSLRQRLDEEKGPPFTLSVGRRP